MSKEEDETYSSPEEGFSASEDEWKPCKESRGGESSDDDDSDFEEDLQSPAGTTGAATKRREPKGRSVIKQNAVKKRKSSMQSLRSRLYNKYKPPPKTLVIRGGSNSPSASTSKVLNAASKNAAPPNDGSDSDNDDKSSDSSVDDYLVDPAELDLRSSFFDVGVKKAAPAAAATPPPNFDCNAGMNLSDSGSEDNNDTSESDTQATENAFDFRNLLEKATDLERVKETIAKRTLSTTGAGQQESQQTNASGVNDVDTLLALGENQNQKKSNDTKSERQKLRQTKSTRQKRNTKTKTAGNDTEDSDWEEVADVAGKHHSTPSHDVTRTEENLEIHVELPDRQRSRKERKQQDLDAILKRKLNRDIKERQLLLHKATLLCCFARSYLYNRLLNDTALMQEALKLLPSKSSYPPERGTELKYYQSLVTWFRTAIRLESEQLYPLKGRTKCGRQGLKDGLIEQLKTKKACCKQDMVLMFVVLVRGMGLQCRLVVNMQPLPLRPAQSELCKITMKKSGGGGNEGTKSKSVLNKKNRNPEEGVEVDAKATKSASERNNKAAAEKAKKPFDEGNTKKCTEKRKRPTENENKKVTDKRNDEKITKNGSEVSNVGVRKLRSRNQAIKKEEAEPMEIKSDHSEHKAEKSCEKSTVQGSNRPKEPNKSSENLPNNEKNFRGKTKDTSEEIALGNQKNTAVQRKGKPIEKLCAKNGTKAGAVNKRNGKEKKTDAEDFQSEEMPSQSLAETEALTDLKAKPQLIDTKKQKKAAIANKIQEEAMKEMENITQQFAQKDSGEEKVSESTNYQTRKPALYKLKRNNATSTAQANAELKKFKVAEMPQYTPIARRTRLASSDKERKPQSGAAEMQKPVIEIGSPVVPKLVLHSDNDASTKSTQTESRAKLAGQLETAANSNAIQRPRSKSPKASISPEFLVTKLFREKFYNNDNKLLKANMAQQRKKSKSPPANNKVKISPEQLFQTKSPSPEPTKPNTRVLRSRQPEKIPQLDGADDAAVEDVKGPLKQRRKLQLDKLRKPPKHSSSDESDFEFSTPPKKKKVARSIPKDRRVLSTDDEAAAVSAKRDPDGTAADIWIEVWSDVEDQWICVDLFKGKLNSVDIIRKSATSNLAYVYAFQNDLSVKDVTARYCPHWSTMVRKSRVDKAWLDTAISRYLGQRTKRDICEDLELRRIHEEKPMPTAISDYKDHPLYVLERHLLKFQAIYPPDPPTLGFIRGEAVYSRDCVHTLHSREIWLKQARTVKLGEQPYKIVKARPKWDRLTQTVIKDQPLEIFGYWQTEDYEPPTAENGLVPRNAYGNVELFKACMLPKKTVHIKLPGLNRVCKKLGIDCANAVIGFDFHQGACHPTFDGFVVCEEFADQVTAAWYQDQEEQERKEQEKYESRVYGNWKKLIRGLLIRERLKKKYNF